MTLKDSAPAAPGPNWLSNGAGLRITSANPTLANDKFQNDSQSAISMDVASDPTITAANAINNNGINGVRIDDDLVRDSLADFGLAWQVAPVQFGDGIAIGAIWTTVGSLNFAADSLTSN
jgi:hypothetical protein